MNKRVARRVGFTLIEVLLVIGILLVLGTVSVVAYSKIKSGFDKDAAKAMVDDTCRAIDLFYTKMSRYPASDKGLQELTTPPDDEAQANIWKQYGPFLKDGLIPNDPWGSPLNYEQVETSGTDVQTGPPFHVWSNGPDRTSGTDDDIRNWTETK